MAAKQLKRTSKALSWLLRHGAEKEGLAIRSDGFVRLAEILAHRSLRGASAADIETVVATSDKQRFAQIREGGVVWVRANQGHTIGTVSDAHLLTPVTAAEAPVCIHGTYRACIGAILREGLSRMARNHVHCAALLPEQGVVSGMRSSCEVAVYVDVQAAMDCGLSFFKSANDVLLTRGPIPPSCFEKVVDLTTGALIAVPEHEKASKVAKTDGKQRQQQQMRAQMADSWRPRVAPGTAQGKAVLGGSAHQIADRLYLGSEEAALRPLPELRALGIGAVVNCTCEGESGTASPHAGAGVEYTRVNVHDNADADILSHLATTADWIAERRSAGTGVLVHCQEGVSRSATVVMAALMRGEGIGRDAAYLRVKEARRIAEPNASFWVQLGQFDAEAQPEPCAAEGPELPQCRVSIEPAAGRWRVSVEVLATPSEPEPEPEPEPGPSAQQKRCWEGNEEAKQSGCGGRGAGSLSYVRGDATAISGRKQPKILAHCCNNHGRFSAGFVLAVKARWPSVARAYFEWHRDRSTNDFGLGAVQFADADGEGVTVANMIGQDGVKGTGSKGPPIRYHALGLALDRVGAMASSTGASVHMPRIGCGLAGGNWEEVEPLVQAMVDKHGVDAVVYDAPNTNGSRKKKKRR